MKTMIASGLLVIAAAAPAAAQAIADVQVTPERLSLEIGQRKPLFAAAYDAQGNIVPGAVITYLSSDTAIAAVAGDGSVTGLAEGSAVVEAVAGGRRDSTRVTVIAPSPSPVTTNPSPAPAPAVQVAGIVLDPPALALLPLEPARVIAHVTTRDSTSPLAVRLAWRSGDTRVAAVDADGVVVGIRPGVTTITAMAPDGVSGSIAVQVDTAVFTTLDHVTMAPGSVDTLHAIIPSQGNRQLTAGLSWFSEDSAIVRALPGGVVQAVAPGQADVLARGYGMTGRIHVQVHQPIVSFTIVPKASEGPVDVPVTTSRRFEARAEDASGAVVDGAPIHFAVADTTIARFDADTRTLTARTVGSTTLTATLEGFAPVVWTINVIPIEVKLDRERIALGVGDRVQLASRLVDGTGAVVPGVAGPLTWGSSRTEVATVSNGAISAVSLGHAVIRASTPWGTTDSVEVYVTGDLLLSSDRAARGGIGIYELRLAEPAAFVPVLADTSTNLHAAFSPDRTRVAFSSNRAGTFDIWVMNADGTGLARVTTDPGSESEPAWTPDGKRIVYTSTAAGQTQIVIVGVDGTGATPLTSGPGGNQSPAVSPDGRLVAFASAREGNYDIYEMNIDGSQVRRITVTPQREQAPQFFANGDLLYASDRPKGGTFIVRQTGTTRHPLAETDDAVLALSLSADGRRYLYLTGHQADRGGSRIDYQVLVRTLDGDTAATVIPLRSGEQVATPSF